ncbi:MAG: LptF/LptG family permease [Bacteroidales bacterium]|nr:LptF/LptG family permease [Bacteroidales bacterium]
MKKLYSYIIRSYIGPFIATFFIALFILLMQFLWKYIDDLVGKGFEWHIIARLLFYASSTFVPLALPLAVLLSSLMAFGNLGERYELVAMKSAGISIKSAIKPMVVFITFLSIIAFVFSNNIMPVANLKMRLLLHDVRKQKPAVSIQPGIFYDEIENYTIKINEKGDDGKTIEDIVIYDHSKKQGNVSVTKADSGTMQVTKDKRFLIFRLFNGKNYLERIRNREDKFSRPLQITEFSEEIRRIDLSSFSFEQTNEQFYKNHYEMMNINQLDKSRDSIKEKIYERKQKFKDSYKDKFTNYQIASRQPQSNSDSSDISYSQLSTIFSSAISSSKNKPSKVSLRNREDVFIQKRSQTQRQEKTKKDTSENKKLNPVSRAGVHGYTVNELKNIAQENELNMDSLMENDPNFPTLISNETNLNPNLLVNFKNKEQKIIIRNAVNNVRNIINNIDYTDNVLDKKAELLRRHDIEWHRKFTLPFACIVLFFIGAPLGAIIRKGGFGFPVVVSVLLFVVYHVVSITGEKFIREGVIEPFWGMWMSAIALLPLGIFLTLKATTDAPFLHSDTYQRIFKKIKSTIKQH